ncbi:hypothetical protein [uncultured Amaricoccus sp.]|uniref:hypothetical protein n=1 Tax=uncultured Amaricoccus sp. TaxID=339341 RepID=UPI0026220397|nr:hypothetical protein [uncultured Amaricoccus sp.]
MFDHLPDPAHDVGPSVDPRLLALQFIATSGAHLLRESGRIGGEAGAALAHAPRDMIVDATVDPAHRPLAETLEMLRQPDARPDAHVDHLIARLSDLRSRIDAA